MNKILCIDDEPAFLTILEGDVSKAGGEFISCSTVESGMQALSERPLLVISDGMNDRWIELAKAAMQQGIRFVLYTTTPPNHRLLERHDLTNITIWDKMKKGESERVEFIKEVLGRSSQFELGQ
jgi:hypothetical protein